VIKDLKAFTKWIAIAVIVGGMAGVINGFAIA